MKTPFSLIERRALLGLAAGAALTPALPVRAQDMARHSAQTGLEVHPLWPNGAPGGEQVTVQEQIILRTPGGDPNDTAYLHIRDPWLAVRRPARPNGAAILMIPGGGYQRVAVSKAGGSIDAGLADLGFTVFVMNYRLPADGWAAGPDVSLQDAQRAIRMVRARADELGFDPTRVAVAGFSAGGHVAGRLATTFDRDAYDPADEIDRLPTRPDAAGLMFPVVTMMEPHAHKVSARALLGTTPPATLRDAYSVERHVPSNAPPLFLAAAADDRVVSAENSLLLWQACRAQNLPCELHLFEKGGHGLADPASGGRPAWMALLDGFLNTAR
ncbi:alpha/beta hydrolase [Brevundimonas sp. SL130]|uniref:alpha/beta hydrolase n=1 Tax=Brevundimonas sp. SL130 TaxID=2995143 RepID=UPI00226CAB6D|nr:alpha/beta hydrolase [Brevundimonas sp. SL130]WAC61444.1 alpha/beta hydrolase [Brevundimonas sp. SL130]